MEDFPNSKEYQDYLKALDEWKAKDKAYKDYLAQNEDYKNSEAYKDYLDDKAVYDQLVDENEIYEDVTDYNTQVGADNAIIDDMLAELDNLDVGVEESIDDVSELNQNVVIDDNLLTILTPAEGEEDKFAYLRDLYADLKDKATADDTDVGTLVKAELTKEKYNALASKKQTLKSEAQKLAEHTGKNAELGSDEYAAYLKAVEDYNALVEEFNKAAKSFNDAAALYNAAVEHYNQNKPADSSSSTGIGTTTSGNKADWGNIKTQNETVGHIDVKYSAAASKNVTTDDEGNKVYSDSVSGYTVNGVYSSEAAAQKNPNSYGVSYQRSNTDTRIRTQEVKPYGGYEFHADNINGITLDMASGKISFYATLQGEKGTENITVNLDANSVYAEGSYYAVSNGGYLGDYRFGEKKDQRLDVVTIDGVQYYDISGHSVYVISALTCDGMRKYGTTLDPWGLDLVLNMQTMIEIHQSVNAEKLGIFTYELEKTAQAEAPDAPGNEPGAPVVADPGDAPTVKYPDEKPNPGPEPGAPVVADPGDAPTINIPGLAPEAGPAPGAPVVADPGDAPTINIPGLEPEAGPAPGAPVVANPGEAPTIEIPGLKPEPGPTPGVPVVADPGNAPTAPTAPAPAHRLNHATGKLNKLNEKIEIVIPPVNPNPNPNPQPNPVMPLNDGGLVTIDDGAVPLADVPKTGDASVVFGAMSAFSGFGLALMQLFGRKKKEEN